MEERRLWERLRGRKLEGAKFRLIDVLLTADDEELTPTMKLQRKVVAQKYGTLIEGMDA